MAISPELTTAPTDSPSGSIVVGEEKVTVLEVNKTSPTLIRAFERDRRLQEQEEARSRFADHVKDGTKRSPLIAVSDVAVRNAMPLRLTQKADAFSTFTLHAGRICLRDAARVLGWSSQTPLAFSTSSFEITVTACGLEESRSTLMDTQQRVVVPVAARNRFELRNGESVLVVTAQEPIAHVRIIPMSLVLAGLAEMETTK